MKLNKCKIFGKYVFNYLPDDKYVGQRIALEKYEPYETELILRQIKSGDIIVDIGANIGYYTVLFADKVGKLGKVIAIEPDPINFEILQKNIKENRLKNVVAVQAAVGSENKKMEIYESKTNYGDHRLWQNPSVDKSGHPPAEAIASAIAGRSPLEERETLNIFCRRLDDLLKDLGYSSVAEAMEGQSKINLIKMDTQGWEPEVFAGAQKTIEKDLPIIFFEYSPTSYKLAKLDETEMMSWLKKLYKKFWWIDEWLYIYKCLEKEKIDKICATNKTGYADLWIKKEIKLNDRIGQFKNLKIKKLIKKILIKDKV